MKNILIKNLSMILFGTLVLCLSLFLIFSSSRSADYAVSFVSTENELVEVFRLDDQEIFSQSSALSGSENSLKMKQELAPAPSANSQTLDAYLRNFSSELMMAADLQEKFDRDEMDHAAATAYEKDLAYVFYQGMDWQEFVPQDISCKKNICRLTLDIRSSDQKNRLMNLLSGQLMTGSIGFYSAIPVSLTIEKRELVYFIRDNAITTTPGVLP